MELEDFSKWKVNELKEYLLQYDITPKDIKGTGKNGNIVKNDLLKAIKKLNKNITKNPQNFTIPEELSNATSFQFTGNNDVDIHILRNLSSYELANLCTTNKYIQKLCYHDKLINAKIKPIIDYVYHPIIPQVIDMHNIRLSFLSNSKDLTFDQFCNNVYLKENYYYEILPEDSGILYAGNGLEINMSRLKPVNGIIKIDEFTVLTYCQLLYLMVKTLNGYNSYAGSRHYIGTYIKNLYMIDGVYKPEYFVIKRVGLTRTNKIFLK